MSIELAKRVAEHYGKLDSVRDVRPVAVTITYKGKAETYYGIRYTAVGHYTADMMACTHNGVKPGTEYTNDRMLLISDAMPRSYKPKVRVGPHWEQRIVYTYDGGEWYISGYMAKENINDQNREFHPFGPHFSLHRNTGDPIDKYDNEPGKRERLAIGVEYLS